MNFLLPDGYQKNSKHEQYLDIPSHIVYQPHVYELAYFLASKCQPKYIIDIGCGSGEKLIPFSSEYTIIGIDCITNLNFFKENLPNAELLGFNLEEGIPDLADQIWSDSLVICSDVIEHLQQPNNLATSLAKISALATFVLISTPDRSRARGWSDLGPPGNPAHVMEWSATEFLMFLRASGFPKINFFGHTINSDLHQSKTTTLILSGRLTQVAENIDQLSVAAIIHVFNEVDILQETIDHLLHEGVDVHIFDNWSTDGSWELINKNLNLGKVKQCFRYPLDKPSENYQWHDQLDVTSQYAISIKADWVMHYDADEIRTSPWQGITLQNALSYIDHLGYNAIDHTVLDFRFLKNRSAVVEKYGSNLNHFEFGRRPGHFKQIKCWRNTTSVDLSSSGGHEAVFDSRKIFPIKFLLKHYSLRNTEQAGKKIFKHRLPRFKLEQSLYGWHTQYSAFKDEKDLVGWNAHELLTWHPHYFLSEFIVERISGVGLIEKQINAVD